MDDELAAIRERRLAELQKSGAEGGRPVEVDEETMGAFLENHPLGVVDVWASWCGPCRTMEPMMEELAREWGGRATVGKLNADESPDFVMKHGIRGIPAFLFFKDGEFVGRLVGARPKRDFEAVLRQIEGKSAEVDPSVQ